MLLRSVVTDREFKNYVEVWVLSLSCDDAHLGRLQEVANFLIKLHGVTCS